MIEEDHLEDCCAGTGEGSFGKLACSGGLGAKGHTYGSRCIWKVELAEGG